MNAPSEDIKDILLAESALALTYARDLFIGIIPQDAADQCVAITDTGGEGLENRYTYERPTVQVLVRGNKGDYLGAQELTQQCRDVLIGIENYTINAARYIGIWCRTDVLYLGEDDNNRPLFSVNFNIHRTTA